MDPSCLVSCPPYIYIYIYIFVIYHVVDWKVSYIVLLWLVYLHMIQLVPNFGFLEKF